MQLARKSALITGGASGIGRATALLFAREGAAIVLADVNADAGQRVAEEIVKAGGRVFFEPVDVTRAADCRRLVGRAIQSWDGSTFYSTTPALFDARRCLTSAKTTGTG